MGVAKSIGVDQVLLKLQRDIDSKKGGKNMIRLQIVEKHGTNLFKTLVEAMRSGKLQTFFVKKRGRRVTHTNPDYHGWMNWSYVEGVIACEVISPRKPGDEWKFLHSLIGRLAHKYSKDIHSISIQFPDTVVSGTIEHRKLQSRRSR